MTIDEFIEDLATGIRGYFDDTWEYEADDLFHPEDLIYHADCFVDALAVALSIFGSKAR